MEKTNSKKHIALFISSLHKGGSERVLVNLAEYFHARSYRVTIVTQYQSDNEYSFNSGITRILSDITGDEGGKGRIANFHRRFQKLRGIWKKQKPDLILSFIGKNNLMAILTSRGLGIPVVVAVRGEPALEYYSGALRLAARTVFGLADGVILQTAGSMDFFPAKIQKKAVILKNPLNPAFIREPYTGEREKQIVAVGRLDANKNHEMIIRAFAGLPDRYREYQLIIYGEGELHQSLRKLSEELGVQERVSLPGPVSDVAEAIYRASVFVLSSYSEGMPNTLLEAMALGLPVISTDCSGGGPRELITDGENGILVKPGDWKNMGENLQKILDNPNYAWRLGESASKMQEKFNPDIINRSWETCLTGMMEHKKRRNEDDMETGC